MFYLGLPDFPMPDFHSNFQVAVAVFVVAASFVVADIGVVVEAVREMVVAVVDVVGVHCLVATEMGRLGYRLAFGFLEKLPVLNYALDKRN